LKILRTMILPGLVLSGMMWAGCSLRDQPPVPAIEPYLARIESPPPVEDRDETASAQGPGEGVPQARPLTLNTCLDVALDRNPLNRAAQEGILIARESAGEVRSAYYPDLSLHAGYSRWQRHAFLPSVFISPQIPTIIGPTDDWSAGLRSRYTIYDSGDRQAQLRAALARQDLAAEEAAAIRQDISLNVHTGYYGYLAALEARSVALENLARSEDHLQLAIDRKAAGAVPKQDVVRAQVEVAEARLALVRAEGLIQVSRGRLNTVMGLPAEVPLDIARTAPEPTSPAGLDLDSAVRDAMRKRHEIRAALQRVGVARYGVDSAKSAFGPKIRAEGGFGWRDAEFLPQDEDWLLGVAVEVPLFTGYALSHRLARTQAELSRQEAEVEKILLSVREEVWSSYSRLQEACEAVQTTAAQVKDAAEGARLARERYAVGAGTMNDLLDAEAALVRASVNQVQAGWDYHVACAVFSRSTGSIPTSSDESALPLQTKR